MSIKILQVTSPLIVAYYLLVISLLSPKIIDHEVSKFSTGKLFILCQSMALSSVILYFVEHISISL